MSSGIFYYPCNMGDPNNAINRGLHRFSASSSGIIVCEFCGEHPPPKVVVPPKRYGLNHPTWTAPNCFGYDTVEEAQAGIERTYGTKSGHTVVEIVGVAR